MNVYKCRFCEKVYSLISHVADHERTHTVETKIETPYECSKVVGKGNFH